MGVSRSLIHLRCQVLVWAALLMLLSADSIRAQIIGDVVSVGFNMRGGGMSGRRVRIGTWTPVVVQLTLQGQTQFNGQLRVRQSDRDGDFCYDYQDVLLQVGADGTATRRYTLYALPAVGPDGAVDIAIELLNEDNEVVKMVSGGRRVSVLRPDPEPVVLADDEYLILYVATSMGKIACLSEMKRFSALRMINIAHITPEQIPDRWQGLEAVDCVVWDEADPDAITNKAEARLNALAEWA
ncbi:MAG: hypothetical protein KAV82_15845, partial [Phycisphaerae bacterium]|nr:hypothetical protein [Phycisphaerae bacterium]